MRIETKRVQSVDVPLDVGRGILRASLTDGALILATGFGDGESFNRPHWYSTPLQLPAEKAPQIISALVALITEDAVGFATGDGETSPVEPSGPAPASSPPHLDPAETDRFMEVARKIGHLRGRGLSSVEELREAATLAQQLPPEATDEDLEALVRERFRLGA